MKNETAIDKKTQAQPMNSVAMPTPNNGALSIFSDSKSFEAAFRMADCLASSTVIPSNYQRNVGNCLIAIEMAARINTSPMMVMQNLYIVNGRPSWSSQWIISMINASRRYKTELQFEFGNAPEDGGLSCQAWAEDQRGHIVKGPKITMKMAQDEGWVSKSGSKWKTMPQVMIQYRAASFFGRMNCPDMIMGIYSAEEAYDMGDFVELDNTGLQVNPETGEVTEKPIVEDVVISQDQRITLFGKAKEYLGDGSNDKVKEMVTAEIGVADTVNLPVSVYHKILAKIVPEAEFEKILKAEGTPEKNNGSARE